MDDYNGPYEQQLLAVFQSCLQEGYSQLTEADLSSLCEKLNLETRLEELKSCIFNNVSDEKLISYHKFRNGLLTLLGSNEESVCEASKQVTTESLQENSHSKVQQNYTNHSNLQSHKGKKPVDRYNSDFRKILNISPTKNSSATVMQVVSDYLGILTLSDQILHQLFDRLDENEDGLINFDEFSVIFQSHRNSEGPVTLEWGGEHYKNWLKEAEQNTSEIIEMQHLGVAERSAIIEKWKIAGIPRAESLLSDLGINSTSINLADLMTILCDELKSICGPDQNVAQILFRAGAVLYQEQLDNLSACLQAERDNLRLNIAKANDRANALAQELDDCHANQEVISQNLKQAEQRYTDAVKELSEELATEREVNTSNLAAQQSQLQNLQQELHSAKAELANIILENGYVEEENQSLREKNKKLKLTNEELLVEIKSLAAEHDEVQKAERGKQEQVIGLVDRIKQLQSENSLLRDHNDELMMELKDLTKSSMEVKGKLDIFMNSPIRSIQSDESLNSNLSGKRCLVDEDPSIRKIFKHESAPEDLEDELPLPFSPIKILSDLRNLQYTDTDLRNKLLNFLSELEGSVTSNKDKNLIELDECLANFKKSIVVEIKNLLSNHSLENNILANKLQSLIYNLEISASRSLVRTETIANSLASELENSISSNLIKSSNLVIENDGVIQNTDDNFNNVNKKYPFKEVIDPEETEDSSDPNFKDKVTSLRDYPPRKEDFTEERVKNKKEKNCKASNDNVSDEKSEYISLRDYPPLKNDFENKKSDQDEKQQLMERCSELEKSLDMLTVEYEACEEYWAHKLEEERQLFEQEQKVSDDKLAELIIKMAEYEELISQPEKPLNDGHLSPIEEKFSLEQQYLDLEEEYEKWKETLHREITARDEEIKELRQRLQINEVVYVDISVQVPEVEFVRSSPCKNSIESSAIQRLPASNNQVPSKSQDRFNFSINNSLSKLDIGKSSQDGSDELDHSKSPSAKKMDVEEPYQLEQFKLKNHFYQSVTSHSDSGTPSSSVKDSSFNSSIRSFSTPVSQTSQCPFCAKQECMDTSCPGKSKPDDPIHIFLLKENHKLLQEVIRLKKKKGSSKYLKSVDIQGAVCHVDINVVQELNMQLHSQEQKYRVLLEFFIKQQYDFQQALHQTWTQHKVQISELQFLLRGAQDKIQLMAQESAIQADKLIRADIIVKDLYVENARLTSSIKKLEHSLV